MQPQKPQKPTSMTSLIRLSKAKAREFTLQSLFKYGYRNKEDISNLPPETLIVGSQNVLTNAAELVGIRQGYALDGAAGNQNNFGIDSAYDFLQSIGTIQNLRKWGTNLEVRYQNPVSGLVSWINLLSNLNSGKVCNFTNFYDLNTEVSMFALFVNGDQNVYEWSGGVGSFASATATTITLQGTQTLGQLGFYKAGANTSKMQLLIGGITYTYTAAGLALVNAFSQTPTTTNLDTAQFISQKFTTTAAAQNIYTAQVGFVGLGFPYTAYVQAYLYSDNAGAPGILIATAQAPATTAGENAIGNPGSGLPVNFTFSFGNIPVSPSTNYHIVVKGGQPNVLGLYVGATAGTGTNTSPLALTPGIWTATNGYMNLIVQENDANPQEFTGVTPSPLLALPTVGDAVIQVPVVGITENANNAKFPFNFEMDVISTLANQVWYGSFASNQVYVSRTNQYTDTSFSTPARLPSEGALIVLDAPTVGFSPQASNMYITAGRDQWWLSQTNSQTVSNTAAGIAISTPTETLFAVRLKTAFNQASQSQGLITNYKNSLVFVSNEQIINALGLVKDIYSDPQITNMSDPIKNDVDAYNFAGGAVDYDNYFIYVAIPAQGIVRMYNVQKQYWEAPQTIPVARFYHVNSVLGSTLYGHSSITNESYQLFTGYNDNGNPINAVFALPYVSSVGGAPFEKKSFNKIYTEGYISSNTSLMLTINYDFGGFSGTYSTNIVGSVLKFIFNKLTDGSIGRASLGTEPIGTILNVPQLSANPKFRIINTMPRIDCYEYQLVYSSDDVDQQWAILRTGPAVSSSSNLAVEITQ